MNPREIKLNRRTGSWSVTPYQTTHNTGGAIMGDNPNNSVVNRYLQSWDVRMSSRWARELSRKTPVITPPPPLPRSPTFSADAIKSQYLKAPGPLVRA